MELSLPPDVSPPHSVAQPQIVAEEFALTYTPNSQLPLPCYDSPPRPAEIPASAASGPPSVVEPLYDDIGTYDDFLPKKTDFHQSYPQDVYNSNFIPSADQYPPTVDGSPADPYPTHTAYQPYPQPDPQPYNDPHVGCAANALNQHYAHQLLGYPSSDYASQSGSFDNRAVP